MQEIRISEQLYRQASDAAKAENVNVDVFVEAAIKSRLLDIQQDAAIQRMFTPERLAEIARAEADIDAGLGLTLEESKAEFARFREAWIRENADKLADAS